jgi:hypothetical protein
MRVVSGMKVDHLGLIGITRWCSRVRPLDEMSFYRGISSDLNWGILAQSSQSSSTERLLSGIAAVLNISACDFQSVKTLDLKLQPQRLLVMGKDLQASLSSQLKLSFSETENYKFDYSLDDILKTPRLKADLWKILKPLLDR